jgi:hypothetical protein
VPPAHVPAWFNDAAPAGQLAAAHEVPSANFWHPPAPSHLPLVPQVEAACVAQKAAGAAVPAGTGAQAPVPETLHAWHAGQLALPQHTPSTQLPLMHWPPDTHVRPLAFSAQLFEPVAPWQVNGATQSPSVAHVARQAPPPQVYGEQALVAGAAQLPVPVQCETGVYVEPVHEAAPHATPTPACAHAPAPLHAPVLPQGGLAAQPPRGSAVPAATLAQVPALPATAHDWHSPHEAVLQQTPSTHELPVRQSAVCVHDWPRRRLLPHRFVCGSQMLGSRQSASTVQAALHAETPLHRNGAQACVVAGLQVPVPSHVRCSVSVDDPVAHEAGAHAVPAA